MAQQFLMGFGQPPAIRLVASKSASAARRRSEATTAALLAQRLKGISEAEFTERGEKACRALRKIKPFWSKFA
jgi:hypothetical protein